MKKRLLFVAVAMFAAASSFAQAMGEYVYTATQRVQIVGENAVTNGSFESANTEGWTNAAGEAVDGAVWSVEDEGVGPNGERALMSVSNSGAACRAFDLAAGSYVVMYDIKGDNTAATGIAETKTNVVNIFLTNSGSLSKQEGDVQVSGVNGYKDTWKTVAYQFEAIDGQKLVIRLENLAANTMITNIKIFPSQLVYDDRILKTKLDYVDKLIATGKFVKDTENGFVGNVVSTMKEMLATPGALDDISGAESLVAAYEGELQLWYDLNAADLLKNEKRWSTLGDTRKQNGMNEGKEGYNWKGTGGRWFHKNNGGSNEITADGDEIGHRFQGGSEGNASQYYTITPVNPGTYMFSLDIVGHYMAGSKSNKNLDPGNGDNYVPDWNRDFKGVTMYAGKDIMGADAEANATMNAEQEGQKVDCGIISNPNAKNNPQKFVVFYEVSQEMVDAQTPVTFGITYILDPDRNPTKMGSNVNIANPQIRLIGITQETIDYQNEVKAIITQQGPLKERLGWANDDMAKTAEEGYPYGKAALKEAIDKYQPVYDASLKVIDVEGTVLNEAYIKQCMADKAAGEGILYSDSLLNTVRAVNSARSAFSRLNKLTSADYNQKVTDAQGVYDDPFFGAGDKATFKTVIDATIAKRIEVLAAANDETIHNDSTVLLAQLETLAKAVETFKASADNQAIIDIDFSNKAEQDAEQNWIIKGAKGEMNFGAGFSLENNVDKSMTYALGCGEEKLDVLRVGSSDATVAFDPTLIGENDVLRVEFDMWFVRLSGKSVNIDLLNADDQRVAGFQYGAYGNETTYNDFDDADHNGMFLNLNTSVVGNTAGDVASCADNNKTSFILQIDYKAQAVQGTTINPNGTFAGKVIAWPTKVGDVELTSHQIAKFRIGCNYNTYQGRRCWFDNLKAYKYASQAEGPVGIKTIENVENAPVKGIFNLQGQRVEKAVKGLYIINGKKVIVK